MALRTDAPLIYFGLLHTRAWAPTHPPTHPPTHTHTHTHTHIFFFALIHCLSMEKRLLDG